MLTIDSCYLIQKCKWRNKLADIKMIRTIFGVDLRTAKEVVERLYEAKRKEVLAEYPSLMLG
jgi:ribosomal protein L7/L12